MSSFLFDGETDPTVGRELRFPTSSKDLVVSAFVGGLLELMTPAIPIPTRPRLFVSGEYMRVFPAARNLALEGQPSRITGPELSAIPALDETNRFFQHPPDKPRTTAFGEIDANGQGAFTRSTMSEIWYSARVGVSFPAEVMGRQIRIKPSFGWMRFNVDLEGFLVDPSCRPAFQCTNVYDGSGNLLNTGFLRESIIRARTTEVFNAYGPGLEFELDTGRFGPLGIALYLGVQGFYIFDERQISISSSESFDDDLGVDTHTAHWSIRVSPWIYRGAVGLRFQWLGLAR